jgi:hypothetical protein
MVFFSTFRLKVFKDDFNKAVAVLTSTGEADEELLELLRVVDAAANDDIVAMVYTLSRVDDAKEQEDTIGCPSLHTLFGHEMEADIYFGVNPWQHACKLPCREQANPAATSANMAVAAAASWAHGQPDFSGSSCMPASLGDVIIDGTAWHHQWHRPVQCHSGSCAGAAPQHGAGVYFRLAVMAAAQRFAGGDA